MADGVQYPTTVNIEEVTSDAPDELEPEPAESGDATPADEPYGTDEAPEPDELGAIAP